MSAGSLHYVLRGSRGRRLLPSLASEKAPSGGLRRPPKPCLQLNLQLNLQLLWIQRLFEELQTRQNQVFVAGRFLSSLEKENAVTDEMFDPEKMEEIIRQMKAEGRMPSFEEFCEAVIEVGREYQKAIRDIRSSEPPDADSWDD